MSTYLHPKYDAIIKCILNDFLKKPEYKDYPKNFEEILETLIQKELLRMAKIEKVSLEVGQISGLQGKGWAINNTLTSSDYKKIDKSHIPIGFLGNVSSGKTYLINSIFSFSIPEIPTNSINFLFSESHSNLVIIDTPGLNKLSLNNIDEIKQIDSITQTLIFESSSIILYVTKSYDLQEQKQCNKIKMRFIQNCHNSNTDSAMKTLMIIHNKPEITNFRNYKNYIEQNILTDQSKFKQIEQRYGDTFVTLIKETISNKLIDKNRDIIHLVLCPYNEDKILEKIRVIISACIQIPFIKVEDLIRTNFELISEGIFQIDKKGVILHDKVIKIDPTYPLSKKKPAEAREDKKGKEDEIEFEELSDEKNNEMSYWKYFENFIPSYSYYYQDDNFILQIEVPNIKKCKILINDDKTKINFLGLKEEKEGEDENGTILKGCYRLKLKIPQGKISQKISHSYSSGLLTITFKLNS